MLRKLLITNADNYAWYATARYVEQQFGKYPKYPSKWDKSKSREENEKVEESEPGYPKELIKEIEVKAEGEVADDTPYKSSAYPDWYLPVLEAKRGDTVHDVDEPKTELPKYHGPDNNGVACDIKCDIKDDSPQLVDCFATMGYLYRYTYSEVIHGKKGKKNWATVSFYISYRPNLIWIF